MTNWLPARAALKRPVYRSLYNLLAGAVENGELASGTRLPTQRDLAHRLGISLQTVGRAYDELARRGLIVGEVGRGTFVRPDQPQPAPPFLTERGSDDPIDLSIQKPVGDAIHAELMKVALAGLQTDLPLSTLFSFRPSLGQGRYREVAVDWLRHCGLTAFPEAIQITNGATPALAVALLSATSRGDVVATEAIGHHMLRALTNYFGLRLHGLAIDEDGIVPETFAEACESHSVKVLVLTPSAANPTVAMVGSSRREAIIEIARRYNILIVEDDAWGPLVEDRPPPIASGAPERCFYVTSFTKCVLPGLRVGYLVAPEQMIHSIANRHLATNWSATSLMAEIATRWVREGSAWQLLEWQRAALRARNALAREILDDVPHRLHPNGLHLWLPLPPAWNEQDFVAQARRQGVAVAPGASFATDPSVETSAVRISVGSTSTEDLRRGLETIVRVIRAEPEPVLLDI